MRARRPALFALSAIAVLLPFLSTAAEAQRATRAPASATASATATPIDWAIDMAVGIRTNLSASEARIAREQMQLQFLSLDAAQRQQIIAATQNLNSEEGVLRVMQMLNGAVESAARQSLAQRTANAQVGAGEQKVQQKLGSTSPTELVFTATVGPCRVADTRILGVQWSGQIGALGARQIYAYDSGGSFDWANQGGTGIAGSGNCAGTVFTGTGPVEVVATITVVNTVSNGALRAWDGTPALTVGAPLAWAAGALVSNTTVVPLNRSGTIYPGSGPFKRDFGVYNNSPTAVDVVVDVLGYFVRNAATPLDCTSILQTDTTLAAGTSQLLSAPACPTGYTAIMAQPVTNAFNVNAGTILQTSCRISNNTGASVGVHCDALCCRLPGI